MPTAEVVFLARPLSPSTTGQVSGLLIGGDWEILALLLPYNSPARVWLPGLGKGES